MLLLHLPYCLCLSQCNSCHNIASAIAITTFPLALALPFLHCNSHYRLTIAIAIITFRLQIPLHYRIPIAMACYCRFHCFYHIACSVAVAHLIYCRDCSQHCCSHCNYHIAIAVANAIATSAFVAAAVAFTNFPSITISTLPLLFCRHKASATIAITTFHCYSPYDTRIAIAIDITTMTIPLPFHLTDCHHCHCCDIIAASIAIIKLQSPLLLHLRDWTLVVP